ncbi:MAG: hypothetical protein JSW25_04025, partial [Thermoplasmata archaeon]
MLLIVFPVLLRDTEELTLGWTVVLMVLGSFITLSAAYEVRGYLWVARPGHVELDGSSVRYYEDGFLMYEIPFGEDLKVGIS